MSPTPARFPSATTAPASPSSPTPISSSSAPASSATFKILYTISDGHGGTSSAFLTVTINGQATQIFVGTKGGDNMLGENDADNMFGDKGNDVIHAPRRQRQGLDGKRATTPSMAGSAATSSSARRARTSSFTSRSPNSALSGAGRDSIKDFAHGDHIDLSALFGGVFTFIKSKAFQPTSRASSATRRAATTSSSRATPPATAPPTSPSASITSARSERATSCCEGA